MIDNNSFYFPNSDVRITLSLNGIFSYFKSSMPARRKLDEISAAKNIVESPEILVSSGQQSEVFEVDIHNIVFWNLVENTVINHMLPIILCLHKLQGIKGSESMGIKMMQWNPFSSPPIQLVFMKKKCGIKEGFRKFG